MDNRRYGLRRFTTAAIPAVLRSLATTAAFAAERAFQDIAASVAVLNTFSSPLLWSRRRDKHDEYYLCLRGDSMAITPFVEQRSSDYGAASSRSTAASKRVSTTARWTRFACFYPCVSVNRRTFTKIRVVSMIRNNMNKHVLYSSSPANFASLMV